MVLDDDGLWQREVFCPAAYLFLHLKVHILGHEVGNVGACKFGVRLAWIGLSAGGQALCCPPQFKIVLDHRPPGGRDRGRWLSGFSFFSDLATWLAACRP